MSNFNNKLKMFLMELKETHEEVNVEEVFETIVFNKSGLKELIKDDTNIDYKFEYIDMREESGGYVTGEIKISKEFSKDIYHVTIDYYCNNITFHANKYIGEYEMQLVSEETNIEWSDFLSNYRKEKIKKLIIEQEKFISNHNIILADLIESLGDIG